MFRKLCLCLLVVTLQSWVVKAQIGRATILGTVTDAQDSVVSSASVTAVHTQTNTAYRATTNEAGIYRFPGVPIGTYEVTVEMPGFKRAVRTGIVLQVDQNARLDFHLEIGAVVESIEVKESTPLVDSSSATVGKVIENERISSLPLNGRSALSLVSLTPNVRSQAQSPSGFGDRGLLVTAFSVNGGPSGMNNITIDGATNLNVRAGDTNVNPTVDSVEEFKVQSGTMSAEYGYTAGGVVNIVTKSGGNTFHGTLYEFLRNDALDARNAFAATKAPFRYNQYGGSLGGPVKKDRTFFFVNYEGWNYRRSYTVIGTVPTLQQRKGDFSDLFDAKGGPVLIYDPKSTIANPAGSGFVRTRFTGNVIPANQLDKAALNILSYYPLPNRTPSNAFTQSNNYEANLGSARDAKQMLIKLDHRISQKNTLSGRYLLWDHKDDNGSSGAGYFSAPEARLRNDDYSNRNVNLTDSHIFSPNVINQFQFNIARQYFPFAGASFGQNLTSKIGLPSSVPDLTVPHVTIPELQGFPAGFAAFVGTNAMQTFQLANGLTWIKGRHSLKFGLELRRNLSNSNSCTNCSGLFNFTTRLTANPQALAGSGYGVASFLLGAVANASIDTALGSSLQNFDQAYYVQDDWKVTRRLTINLGLRYDYQQVPWERHNGLSRFNPSAINPQNGLLGRLEYAGVDFGRTVLDPDYNDFGPRVGFAWDLFGSGKTVVRGGYGVFYPLTFIYARSFGSQGFRNSTTYNAPGGNVDQPAFYLQNGFPSPVVLPQGAALGPSAFLSQAVTLDESSGRSPYSQQFTLTIQHELPGKMLLEVGYAGNKGTKLGAGNYDLDQLDPKYLSLGKTLLDQVPNPYVNRVPGAFGGATISRQQLLRPYPYYSAITVSSPHLGSSIYHSMLLNVEKRMSKGLVLLASYTYGKLISDGIFGYSQNGTEQVNVLDYQNGTYDRRSERALDSIDSGARFVTSGVYELPFGPGKQWHTQNGFASRLISGWQLNGVLVLQQGLPLVIRGANNNLATRPNSTGVSAQLDHPTAAQWFNVNEFVNPPDFTYGNIGRTLPDVRSPGIKNLDFSVVKNTAIVERLNLQFRAEAFNLFNNVNLLAPNTTFVPGANGKNQSATFGVITSSRDARIIQLALKLIF